MTTLVKGRAAPDYLSMRVRGQLTWHAVPRDQQALIYNSSITNIF